MCKKKRLGQQALADAFDMKRGKVSGYFYETQPKPDFYEKLGEKFDLDIGKFLTVEMNDDNYVSFFLVDFDQKGTSIGDKTTVLELLVRLKNTLDQEERNVLIDELILVYDKNQAKLEQLKDQNSELKDQLIGLMQKDN